MLGTFGLRAYRHVHVYTCERRISVCASHEHHIRLNWVKALHVARGTSGTSHQTLRACRLASFSTVSKLIRRLPRSR